MPLQTPSQAKIVHRTSRTASWQTAQVKPTAYFPLPNTQSALFSAAFHWAAYINVWKLSKKYYTRLLCIEQHFQSGNLKTF